MVWRLRETWALQVDFFNFAHHVKAYKIFAWFTPSFMHSHMVTGYRFLGGPIALHGLVHFLNTTGPSLTKVVYAYFDRSSCTYI